MPLFDTTIRVVYNHLNLTPFGLVSIRNYAARKGTRAKRAKSKVKVEVQKVGFIPHNQRDLASFLASRPKLKFDDSWKQLPLDNVYPHKYYQWTVYPFIEAIQCLKETNHPDMYNQPNANVHVNIDLNMEGEKKNRMHDNFYRIAPIPHKFDHVEERTVMVFTKDVAKQEAARAAGAGMAGGVELIKDIQNGSIMLTDFQHFVAEPTILPELVSLRGLMKRKFPNPNAGTLDDDVTMVVERIVNGVNYSALKDEYEKDFGQVKTVIGNLNMEPHHLEANFISLIKDIHSVKPKREGPFITRCLLWSPPSNEKLKVDHKQYLDIKETKKLKRQQSGNEVSDEVQEAVVQ